jgi:mRNA degradation ribonuclease J1/J2
MNSSDFCHDVADVPGLYVDAFRGRLLRKTQDPDACFILTHFHGDHYQSLPKEGRYIGPAIIHCSPVTAALLKEMHQVPPHLVAAHEYGASFEYQPKGNGKDQKRVTITFYDANHCPGACIVLIQLPSGYCHLHTGDMRYCEKFKSYPLLQDAVAKKKVDLVYLDTTYSHPKHDFVPQEEAVETIASQTKELLSSKSKVLVLLSCYSIGKEKVLWEASVRADQQLYVSERKMRMLKCVQLQESQEAYQIINRCTEDPSKSDIHVISMGLAGEVFPFFRPNFIKCKDYVEKLDKEYDKVVAFLPTGE